MLDGHMNSAAFEDMGVGGQGDNKDKCKMETECTQTYDSGDGGTTESFMLTKYRSCCFRSTVTFLEDFTRINGKEM